MRTVRTTKMKFVLYGEEFNRPERPTWSIICSITGPRRDDAEPAYLEGKIEGLLTQPDHWEHVETFGVHCLYMFWERFEEPAVHVDLRVEKTLTREELLPWQV